MTTDGGGASSDDVQRNVAANIAALTGEPQCRADPRTHVAGVRAPNWLTTDSPQKTFLSIGLLALLAVITGVEIAGVVGGGPTISGLARQANAQSGGLLALTLAGVWIHIFCDLSGIKLWSSPKYAAAYTCAS